jgi:hypothetical protein
MARGNRNARRVCVVQVSARSRRAMPVRPVRRRMDEPRTCTHCRDSQLQFVGRKGDGSTLTEVSRCERCGRLEIFYETQVTWQAGRHVAWLAHKILEESVH